MSNPNETATILLRKRMKDILEHPECCPTCKQPSAKDMLKAGAMYLKVTDKPRKGWTGRYPNRKARPKQAQPDNSGLNDLISREFPQMEQ